MLTYPLLVVETDETIFMIPRKWLMEVLEILNQKHSMDAIMKKGGLKAFYFDHEGKASGHLVPKASEQKRLSMVSTILFLRKYLQVPENLNALARLQPMELILGWDDDTEGTISIGITDIKGNQKWSINPDRSPAEDHHLWYRS